MIYTKEERDSQIRKMRVAAANFYREATHTGVHAFVEFCGMMNKFVDICRRTSEAGRDFNEANIHNGEALAAENHDLAYLAEKFECIFGTTLQSPENRAAFLEAMEWSRMNKTGEMPPVRPKSRYEYETELDLLRKEKNRVASILGRMVLVFESHVPAEKGYEVVTSLAWSAVSPEACPLKEEDEKFLTELEEKMHAPPEDPGCLNELADNELVDRIDHPDKDRVLKTLDRIFGDLVGPSPTRE